MDCINCKSTGRLDRVVLDILTGTELGVLCEACLDTRYDPVFKDDIWHEDSGCAVCAEQPHYHLPLIDCLIEYSDDRSDELEYGVTDTTVRLCSEHLEELLTTTPDEIQASGAVVTQ